MLLLRLHWYHEHHFSYSEWIFIASAVKAGSKELIHHQFFESIYDIWHIITLYKLGTKRWSQAVGKWWFELFLNGTRKGDTFVEIIDVWSGVGGRTVWFILLKFLAFLCKTQLFNKKWGSWYIFIPMTKSTQASHTHLSSHEIDTFLALVNRFDSQTQPHAIQPQKPRDKKHKKARFYLHIYSFPSISAAIVIHKLTRLFHSHASARSLCHDQLEKIN